VVAARAVRLPYLAVVSVFKWFGTICGLRCLEWRLWLILGFATISQRIANSSLVRVTASVI
jgi:hypothetical protein